MAEALSVQLPSIPGSPFGARYLKLESIPTSKLDRARLDKQNHSQFCRWSVIVLAAECDNPKSVAYGEVGGGRKGWNDISRWI